jgi:hypothetical protein
MVKTPPALLSDLTADAQPLQHGIRRVKQSAEALALKREKEREKLLAYLELEGHVLDLVSLFISTLVSLVRCGGLARG